MDAYIIVSISVEILRQKIMIFQFPCLIFSQMLNTLDINASNSIQIKTKRDHKFPFKCIYSYYQVDCLFDNFGGPEKGRLGRYL